LPTTQGRVISWWRLREAAGTTHYEWSDDGISFSSIASIATPIAVTNTNLTLFGGSIPGSPAILEVRYDKLNPSP
jgi:hypothetical protein